MTTALLNDKENGRLEAGDGRSTSQHDDDWRGTTVSDAYGARYGRLEGHSESLKGQHSSQTVAQP